MKARFMSDFDHEQIAKLRPLAELNALVRVPLFANTLPLGYHYARACGSERGQRDHRVGLVPWGVAPLVELVTRAHKNEAPAVFYCTRQYLPKIAKAAALPDLHERISYIPITQYRPRWIFLRNTIHLREECQWIDSPSFGDVSSEIADCLLTDNEWAELFTDTPDQARSLGRFLADALDGAEVRVIDAMDPDALLAPRRPHRVFELFYFSAPIASTLRHDRRYVAVQLPDETVEGDAHDDFATGMAIVASDKDPQSVADIQKAIGEYHTALFDRCVSANEDFAVATDSFAETTWVYNRLARAQRIGDTFVSEMQYAQCVAEHHSTPY